MAAQNTKMKNIITTMGSPKLLFSSSPGFIPPIRVNASRPAMPGQMMSMKIQPYSTPRKIPMRFMPSGVRGSMGGNWPKPNMIARQISECTRYIASFFPETALCADMALLLAARRGGRVAGIVGETEIVLITAGHGMPIFRQRHRFPGHAHGIAVPPFDSLSQAR